MSQNLLPLIADKVINRPLLILPEKLAAIQEVLHSRIGIDGSASTLTPEQREQMMPGEHRYGMVATFEKDANGKRKVFRQTPDGTAVIPIIGSLVNRGDWIDAMSGVASYQNIKQQLEAAASDPSISDIVLDIDSPGGEAVGAFEVGDAVAQAAASKPITAVANGLCCSAAYAIASRADKIVASRSAIVGSIGVVLLHVDHSAMLHEAGLKPTLIHAGARKVDGHPYGPLDSISAASLKSEVETFMDLFVENVAQGRSGLTTEAIRATEARTYIGAKAVEVGLADTVGTFESVIAGISSRASVRRATGAKSMDKNDTVSKADHEAAVAAVRAEAHAAGKAEGVKEGKVAGMTEERGRVAAILGHENAKGRESAALAVAQTGASVEVAAAALGAMPVIPAATASGVPAGQRSKDASAGLVVDGAPAAQGGKDESQMNDFEKGKAAVKGKAA